MVLTFRNTGGQSTWGKYSVIFPPPTAVTINSVTTSASPFTYPNTSADLTGKTTVNGVTYTVYTFNTISTTTTYTVNYTCTLPTTIYTLAVGGGGAGQTAGGGGGGVVMLPVSIPAGTSTINVSVGGGGAGGEIGQEVGVDRMPGEFIDRDGVAVRRIVGRAAVHRGRQGEGLLQHARRQQIPRLAAGPCAVGG